MILNIDHIALGASEFDAQRDFFTQTLGLELKRLGTRHSTGTRIAMLADRSSNFKVELIETQAGEATGFLHLAARVGDLQVEFERLTSQGLQVVRAPHALPAAKAQTAVLQTASGLQIQLIEYAPDSPDIQ